MPTAVIAARRTATRSALRAVLEREPRVVSAGTAPDLSALIRLLRGEPDVVVVEASVLGEAGVRRLPTLSALAPHAAFIVVGMGDHPGFAARARAVGAVAYVRLDQAAERLPHAVLSVASARTAEL